MKYMFILLAVGVSYCSEVEEWRLVLPVESIEEIKERQVERQPYEYCWFEKEPVQLSRKFNSGGPILGGAVGTQIGKGGGKDARDTCYSYPLTGILLAGLLSFFEAKNDFSMFRVPSNTERLKLNYNILRKKTGEQSRCCA